MAQTKLELDLVRLKHAHELPVAVFASKAWLDRVPQGDDIDFVLWERVGYMITDEFYTVLKDHHHDP